jgi:diaminopimelate epimerase
MRVDFVKMTGAGNDFVVIDNRAGKIKSASKIAKLLCDRRWGIGADGLLLVGRSKRASYKMLYYNADGSYGGMCGNGGRCIAFFAYWKKIAGKTHDFEALDHIYSAKISKNEVVLWMKDPIALRIGEEINVGTVKLRVNSVDTGSPHVVVPIESMGPKAALDNLDVVGLGRQIRNDAHFSPNGTNVNFIQRQGSKSIQIRTYERGVEDETLACGTGSIASAVVASRLWGMKPPIRIVPRSKVALRVEFDESAGTITNVRLTGPAKVVYSGSIVL